MSKQDELMSLRGSIVEKVIPLIDSDTLEPQDRFELALQIAEMRGEVDMYHKAYGIAQDITDRDDQLRSYLDLLGSVDAELGRDGFGESDNKIDSAEE